MKTAFFISWRYQKNKQKNGLVSLISLFSTLGITLGVAVLILGLSAMNGFERELNQRILAVVPHVQLFPLQQETLKKDALVQALQQDKAIKGMAPFVSFTALVEKNNQLKVVQIKGVEQDAQDAVSHLGWFVQNHAWQTFQQQQGIILGAGIAKSLNVTQGDWVTLLLSDQQTELAFAQPKRERIQVTGILRLEGQLDYSYALMPLAKAQQLLGLAPNEVSGVELALYQPFQVQQLTFPALLDYPQPLYAQNWSQSFGYMYQDIHLIRMIMYIAMVLVISVACFNIISTLMMAVKDKQGDIAILQTLGASPRFIQQIFIYYGLQVGLKGCLYGIILGSVLSLNLTKIMQFFEKLIGHKLLSEGVYFIDFLPSELHIQDLLWVMTCALILSLCASLYPARRAMKLNPAQVLSNY